MYLGEIGGEIEADKIFSNLLSENTNISRIMSPLRLRNLVRNHAFSSPVTHEDRAELIVPLIKHKNPDVSTWATLEIERLKYYGKQSRKMEENYMLSGRLPGHGWTLNDEEGKDFNK